MDKTLIVITRGTRAERPSEDVIESDSDLFVAGQAPSQDPTKDNFFRVNGDPVKHAIRLLAFNAENPYGRQVSDGTAFYSYSHAQKTTNANALRTWPGEDMDGNPITITAKAHVQYTTENESGTNIYDTLQEALDFIDTLDPSDGYNLLDEGPDTEVIQTRPSLWPHIEPHIDGVNYDTDLSVKTTHAARLNETDRY